jgi:hypothetical protein
MEIKNKFLYNLLNITPLNILNGTPEGVPLDVSRATLPINQLKSTVIFDDRSNSNVHRCKKENKYENKNENEDEDNIFIKGGGTTINDKIKRLLFERAKYLLSDIITKHEEESRKKAQALEELKKEEARKKAEEEARKKAEEEARKKAEEEARKKAEALKKANEKRAKEIADAKEEARKKAEALAKEEEEQKRKAEEKEEEQKRIEARKKEEEEEQKRIEEEEEEQKRIEEEQEEQKRIEARKKEEEEQKRIQEQKRIEEQKRIAKEEARKKEEEQQKRIEEEKRKAEAEAEEQNQMPPLPLLFQNKILKKIIKNKELKQQNKGLIFVYKDKNQQYNVDTIFDYTNDTNIYPNNINNIDNIDNFLEHIHKYINNEQK